MKTHMSYRKYLLILGISGAFFTLAPMALATTPPPPTVATVAPKTSVPTTGTSGTSFVSMTQFPAFSTDASGGLGAFINSLYKYLIGIAAILAVLEITWGGFLWMGSGASVTSKEAGRKKIMMALTGLLLVLSPVIIFSIINPSVLSLKLGINAIKITAPISSSTPAVATPATGCTSAGGGTLLKKYVCAGTLANTAKYCTGALSKATVACSVTDSSTGKCTSKILYCSAPASSASSIYTPQLKAYAYLFKGDKIGKSVFFPQSVTVYNQFLTSCNSNGGSVNEKIIYGINFINKNGHSEKKVHLYNFYKPIRLSCTNYPKINVLSNVLRTACFGVRLLCTPPPTN